MQTTIGGNRVGSGQKMKAYMHNYFRSTHNLSEKWASSMGSGILYPCFVKPAMRGDVFEIGINADARTIPTKGPLFGSFKMQIDFYQCPVRLYQALLHNNPTNIGLKMSQVKLPLVRVESLLNSNIDHEQNVGEFSKSCLLKYLGVSGLGVLQANSHDGDTAERQFNAVPLLAYYDIFKNYYANKQEEKAYVITPKTLTSAELVTWSSWEVDGVVEEKNSVELNHYDWDSPTQFTIVGENLTYKNCGIRFFDGNGSVEVTLNELAQNNIMTFEGASSTSIGGFINIQKAWSIYGHENMVAYTKTVEYKGMQLTKFDLKNIDDMRYTLLSHHTMGVPYVIDNGSYYPYKANCTTTPLDRTFNAYPLNGLVLKTYQNDIFNNWLNKNWIEGENSIGALTSVSVVDGKFSMDALNFAKKLYNMLNRVAVTDGTYESWQDVMYEEVARKQIESPIFLGGMSQEIMFDEIVQTAPADGDPLGTLGGRGRLVGKQKGGKIRVRVDEASFIIGICSLTPRIFQTQGNEFYMTDILTMDDFHKPGMDGIGFQDLIGERMAWFDTALEDSNSTPANRNKIGKLPAWIEYMTSVDRAYGDLAENYGKGYMILNRNYEAKPDYTAGIVDATTYIDPTKYNYAFAYTELDAQNFWVEIAFDVKARRKMSARLIPNV